MKRHVDINNRLINYLKWILILITLLFPLRTQQQQIQASQLTQTPVELAPQLATSTTSLQQVKSFQEVLPQVTEVPTPLSFKEKALQLIDKYSVEYSLSAIQKNQLIQTMQCETAGTFDPTMQSQDRRPDGSQERSFGLAQIFLPAHPDITEDQAKDPDFAVEFMAKGFKAGSENQLWTCYQFVTTGKW